MSDAERRIRDAEDCLRDWAVHHAGPGTTHWQGCASEHPACAALAVLRELHEARREKLDIISAAYESERRGQKYERELARELDAMRPVVEAAVAWWRGDPDEDLARAVADYVAAHRHKIEITAE